MKIGINLLPLRPGKNGGLEVYIRNLLVTLLKIDTENQYFLITAPYNHSSLNYEFPNCKKILYNREMGISGFFHSIYNRILQRKSIDSWGLEYLLGEYNFDIWFCPLMSLDPRPIRIPSIVTIPDIQHEFYPEFFTKEELSLRKKYIMPSCELATEIITISEFSKITFVEKLGVNPEKINVVHLAAGNDFIDNNILIDNILIDNIIKKYDLPVEYLFYPANAWPHKNHINLIAAFNLYRKTYNHQICLVLSGSGLKEQRSIANIIKQNNLQDSVKILNYVDKNDLPALYKNAKCLVFPSLFEGFGIPPLEAMAVGCPVIVSNTASIPEIVGDSALLFDPNNIDSIVNAMHHILNDEKLRKILIQKGTERVKKFSYTTVANKHLNIFSKALSKARDVEAAYKYNEEIYFKGIFSDGWVSKLEFNYSGQKKFKAVQLKIISPLPHKYPLRIKMVLNKNTKEELIIPSTGVFFFEKEILNCMTNDREFNLVLHPDKIVIPNRVGINNDERKLSFILKKLTLIDINGIPTDYLPNT